MARSKTAFDAPYDEYGGTLHSPPLARHKHGRPPTSPLEPAETLTPCTSGSFTHKLYRDIVGPLTSCITQYREPLTAGGPLQALA